ncbi:hypothetical protein ES689_10510 [Frigoribacterium sp. ACAM 257]|uniref:hypothetical protein n=1 Tax=Frigoribacterium sp. ACAM 257 TaxID=2508998 RepID=UPI0011B98A70|nr:hypothetical protein [Frigoribacterium sp. ACAM 257]TWX37112.1 hypothetical protein ES689_10510 [Frigoribacterium sp. ACAM 257]
MLDSTILPSPRPASVAGRELGDRRRGRRARLAWVLAVGTLLVGLSATIGPIGPAEAAGAPTESPAPQLGAPTPTPDPTTPPATPTAPTVRPVDDSATGTVLVQGEATPAARVKVALTGNGAYRDLCPSVTTTTTGAWSCSASVPSGAGWTAVVTDLDHTDLDQATSPSFSVLTAPTVGSGLLVGAKIGGAAFPGAMVTVTSESGSAATATTSADGSWVAVLPAAGFPSGRHAVRAVQSSAAVPDVPVSASSPASSVVVDRDAPVAPVVTSPTSGQRVAALPLAVSGTGEAGALATVYVDSTPVCQATVSGGGTWSCSAGGSELGDGDRVVQAALVDQAGNYGPPSAAVRVTIGVLASAPPSSGATATPRPGPTATPSPGAVPPPTAPTGPSDDGAGAPGSPVGPDDGGTPGNTAPGTDEGTQTGTWATATTFGADLPTLAQTLGGPVWPLGVAVALLFLVLVAGPSRLAAASARGRFRPRAARLTGRNRSSELPTSFNRGAVDPRVASGLALAAGAVAIAVAAGVDGQVQYARLLAGIVVGLVALNGLVVLLPAVLVARRLGLSLRVRMSPGLLLAAVVACGATRLFSLDPPLVLGVLLVTTLGAVRPGGHHAVGTGRTPSGRDRGVLSAAQLSAGVVVPATAWVLHGLVDAAGAWPQLGRESLATVCLAGLGSLVVHLLPVGSLPGRHVWAWSKTIYGVLAVVGVSVAAAVFVGAPSSSFPLPALLVTSLVAALLAVAAWLWTTWVEPARRAL